MGLIHVWSEKVILQVSLTIDQPNIISISDPLSSDPLKLNATISQISSPFPNRAVTILTTSTMLDHDIEYTFRRQLMASPISVKDKNREIWMYPKGWRINHGRPQSGNPDLRMRDEKTFITIPPVGQGEHRVEREISPELLLKRYKPSSSPQEKLADFSIGEYFELAVKDPTIDWWTWGSLDADLKLNKFARWSFSDDLSLDRMPESDETEEESHKLQDYVDGHDVNHLTSASAVEDEEIPNIRQMRKEEWVFGEPRDGLEVIAEDTARFELVL